MHAQLFWSCPTLCDPLDCSLQGSSVHGILQARTVEWVAMPSSRGTSQPRDWTHVSWVSCIGGQVLCHWASWEACSYYSLIGSFPYLHTQGSTPLRACSISHSSAHHTGQWSRWKHPLGIDRIDSCPFETCLRHCTPRCWTRRLALFLEELKQTKHIQSHFWVVPFHVFQTASRKYCTRLKFNGTFLNSI